MATTTSLQPKTISPFLTNPPSITHFTKPFFLNHPQQGQQPRKPAIHTQAKKAPWFIDPFDQEEDPNLEYGSLFKDGKQEEDPTPPDNPDNPYGFLKFPMGYCVEIASLASKVRGDVRSCCCVISGGVYENLLFFPAIQLIKDRYPGVLVDVITTPRGKQTYELNKNVRWANEFDPDDGFVDPTEYMDMLGLLKNRYYDLILSTKLAGLGHASFLFMTSARDRISYIYPNVNAAGAGLFLSETFRADSMNLSERGYHMYHQMLDWLGRPYRSLPRQPVPPLKVSISRKLKAVVEAKYRNAGVEKGKYIVLHGIESDSQASMQSKGDTDSLLPIQKWAKVAETVREFTPLFVIPHERERENVEEIVGDEASIVFITTPGQLAALINDSAGVISTNTAAIQLANAREKPSIALFGSEEKAKLFVPNAAEKKCVTVSSKTGKLIDIDVENVKNSMQIFEVSSSYLKEEGQQALSPLVNLSVS